MTTESSDSSTENLASVSCSATHIAALLVNESQLRTDGWRLPYFVCRVNGPVFTLDLPCARAKNMIIWS